MPNHDLDATVNLSTRIEARAEEASPYAEPNHLQEMAQVEARVQAEAWNSPAAGPAFPPSIPALGPDGVADGAYDPRAYDPRVAAAPAFAAPPPSPPEFVEPMAWSGGPTDLVPVNGLTPYSARSQFRQDEGGNYQNWQYGEGSRARARTEGPHPDWNHNRAQEPPPAWQPDAAAQDAAYADILDVDSAPRDRSREQHAEFRDSLVADDELIYGGGLGGRFRKGFDKFTKSPLGEWVGSTEASWSLGFGGMQAVSNLTKAVSPLVSGDSYLPDQVQEQALTSALPLLGSIAGTLIGSRLGPGGGMGGQFLGQSVGAGIEEVADTYFSGHTAAQERAGAAIGEGQGGAGAVKELTDALTQALTPAAKELAETLSKLSQSAPVGASAPAEFGQFQLGMGVGFAANAQGEERFLSSNPFLAPVRSAFNSNPLTALSPGDYLGNAAAAAMAGDYDGMKSSFAFAETETDRNTANPQYQGDADFIKRREGESVWQKGVEDLFVPTRVRAYNVARQRLTGEVPDGPGAADARKAVTAQEDEIRQEWMTHTLDEANVGYAGSLLGADSAALSGAMARGGGSAALRGAIPDMQKDATLATSALQTDIEDNEANARKHPLQRAVFLANEAADREQAAKIGASLDATRKAAFDTGMQEEGANFGLYADKHALGGTSAADMLYGYRKQADYLSGVAADPRNPLSPSERMGMEDSAVRLRYTAAQNVYQEENLNLDVTRAQREGSVTRAEYLGTPGDVYKESINSIQTDRDQISQNNSEIQRGNLTNAQKLKLERENVSLQTEIDVAPEKARQGYYGAETALLGGNQGGDRAGLSRDVGLYGNTAFTMHNVAGDDQAAITNSYRDYQTSPTGSVQQARAFQHWKSDLAQQTEDQDNGFTWRQTQDGRMHDMRDAHAYERAQKAPFMDGPDSNVLTRGNAVLKDLQIDLQGQEAALARTPQNSPAYERNALKVEDTKDRIADFMHDRIYEGVLPQEIEKHIGLPGGGIGVAISPLIAAAQGSGPYNPAFGGFGSHPNPLMTSVGGMEHEGGAMGMWWATKGGNQITPPQATSPGHSPAMTGGQSGGGSIIGSSKTDDLLIQAVGLLRQIAQNGRGGGQQVPMPQAGVHAYFQDNATLR